MVSRRRLLAASLAGAAVPALPARAEDLGSRLTPLIQAHKGEVAVGVRHLVTGEGFSYHAEDPMPTASLIKLAVMIETYRQANDGKVDLQKPIMLKAEDR